MDLRFGNIFGKTMSTVIGDGTTGMGGGATNHHAMRDFEARLPGCRILRIEPHLGDLQWAEGTFPAPLGIIKVRHAKRSDGTIETTIEAPEGAGIKSRADQREPGVRYQNQSNPILSGRRITM